MNIVNFDDHLEYDDLKVRELNECLKTLDIINRKIIECIEGYDNDNSQEE